MDSRDDRNTAVVENAARLLSDGKLLIDHGRHASAFALAVLALEEIGKLLLKLWGVPEGKGYDHLSKQQSGVEEQQGATQSLTVCGP